MFTFVCDFSPNLFSDPIRELIQNEPLFCQSFIADSPLSFFNLWAKYGHFREFSVIFTQLDGTAIRIMESLSKVHPRLVTLVCHTGNVTMSMQLPLETVFLSYSEYQNTSCFPEAYRLALKKRHELEFLQPDTGESPLLCKNIQYIESTVRKLQFHTSMRHLSCYGKLEDYEHQLEFPFCRCHQSFIVNLAHVRAMTEHAFLLFSDQVIPISRSRYKEAEQQWNRFHQQSTSFSLL